MTTFFNRTSAEQDLIRKAYDFEVNTIETGCADSNPYRKAVQAMGLWEAIEDALELAYR